MPNDVAQPRPRTVSELNHIGAQYFAKNQYDAARLHFLAALGLDPNEPTVLQNLGATLRLQGHYTASESVARKSVALTKGENPYALQNLGVAQLSLKKHGDAIATFKAALKIAPTLGPVWHNYGIALYTLGRYKDAIEAMDKAISCGHDTPQCRSDRALALLSLGDIQPGLAEYECRWKTLYQNKIWKTTIPEWKGEDLAGVNLLVHHEQGFGDSLMLVRFVKQLATRGAQITLAVPIELVDLFQQSFPQIQVVDLDEDLENSAEFDYHTPLLSAMRWLGLVRPEEISKAPYLKAVQRSKIHLPNAKFKIGLCWASGNHGPELMERRRVISVTEFLPLTEIPNVGVVSLQVGDGGQELVRNGLEGLIYDVSYRIDNFADTAEIISHLDLVISVDSAVAHLAGAMGKPCIMLSPYTRCWRWWSNRSGWPWYGDMTQFHQAADGSWKIAVQQAISTARGNMNRYIA